MSEDKRDQLGILRYELNFIEQGGYPIAWTIKYREANSEHGISK